MGKMLEKHSHSMERILLYTAPVIAFIIGLLIFKPPNVAERLGIVLPFWFIYWVMLIVMRI